MARREGGGGGEQVASSGVRRAVELIEQAPAEALYAKLMNVLTEAGRDVSVRGDESSSKRLAFAYKLAVELGGKMALLEADDLNWRRKLAATLLGEGAQPSWEEATGEDGDDHDPDEGRIWTPRGWF
jgi:hypothetical protein